MKGDRDEGEKIGWGFKVQVEECVFNLLGSDKLFRFLIRRVIILEQCFWKIRFRVFIG